MKGEIVLQASEFDKGAFERLKAIIKSWNVSEITINLDDKKPARHLRKETQAQTNARIEEAARDIKAGNVVSFTGDEFKKFSDGLLKKKVA